MTTVNFNDNRQNPIQTLIGFFLIILAAGVLFGLVPGFFIASIIDKIIALKTGPIWATTLLCTAALFFFLFRFFKSNIKKALTMYVVLSTILTIVLVTGALFTQGDIFYGYTSEKMFYFFNYNDAEKVFKDVELRRGRETTHHLTWVQIKDLEKSNNREKLIQELGFKFDSIFELRDDTSLIFSRTEDNIETCYLGKSSNDVEYYTQNENIFLHIKLSIINDGFSLIDHTGNENEDRWEYRKGNMNAWAVFDKNDKEQPYVIHYEKVSK